MKEKNLHIGFIIFSSHKVPAWYAETIKLVHSRGFEVSFLVLPQQEENEKLSTFYRLFQAFEQKWFQSSFDAAKISSISAFVTTKVAIPINPAEISSSDIEKISSLNLDVLYAISPHLHLKKAFSNFSKYGLWYIVFGNEDYAADSPPAFWEVMDDNAVTGSSLCVYVRGTTKLAYSGTTRSIPYSVKNNFNSIAWKSASYLPLRLSSLEDLGALYTSSLPEVAVRTHKRKKPGNLQMLLLFAKNIGGYLGYKIKSKLNKGRFTILYSMTTFNIQNLKSVSWRSITLPKNDTFYADPFVVEEEGINYIFYEEMDRAKNKAHISLISINQNGKLGSPKIILDKPYHLSYPFVFKHDGIYYMIPETASNKTVELYRTTSFPEQWEFVMNLMEDVELLDVTLHFANNKWWMFANSSNHPFVSTNDQLFLFSSNDLFSKTWAPHPQNPIATQAANCRPAGRLFTIDGVLYRPAQNNASQQYGYGLKINQIELLSETEYKEKEVCDLHPETFGLKACHHLDFSSTLIVSDGILR